MVYLGVLMTLPPSPDRWLQGDKAATSLEEQTPPPLVNQRYASVLLLCVGAMACMFPPTGTTLLRWIPLEKVTGVTGINY